VLLVHQLRVDFAALGVVSNAALYDATASVLFVCLLAVVSTLALMVVAWPQRSRGAVDVALLAVATVVVALTAADVLMIRDLRDSAMTGSSLNHFSRWVVGLLLS